ncbi:DUF5988 family protein [Streptomyces platensis]|uniref:DUF5988 family protein n=1 Tax=Streptomyces platensis TaxID=58346 RepID=UPI002254D2BE|nr:DUF5988 family protein [Streptomyces platensis]MCX4638578.1 DUF5988 family protein [Streptomyces platensis]WSI54009.1 DUF5988 family protein [Streptomyces platensis]WTI56067.1 DUF5988 family protein [Streptomyces platensis]WUB78412.1 DUF5988 family protein [Streptomyces platensis]
MTNTDKPNAILKGGPSHFPEHLRIRHLTDPTEKVKVLFGNRYEHFEATSETTNQPVDGLQVFVWVDHTYIAE